MSLGLTLEKLEELEREFDVVLPLLSEPATSASETTTSSKSESATKHQQAQLLIYQLYLINSLSFILLRLNGCTLDRVKQELKRVQQYWEKLHRIRIDPAAAKRIVKQLTSNPSN